jgi:hypothetical protein
MKYSSLLLLFALLVGPLAAANYAVEPAANPNVATVPAAGLSTALMSSSPDSAFTLPGPEQGNVDIADSSANDICYKIRAYIFKRDDDHAPELVGSTTCGPRQPHAKNALWPEAKLVPAK